MCVECAFPENTQTSTTEEIGKFGSWRGRGLKGLGNFSGVRGLRNKIHFQRARTMIVSHPLLWVALMLSLVMLCFSYHASAQNDFSFL